MTPHSLIRHVFWAVCKIDLVAVWNTHLVSGAEDFLIEQRTVVVALEIVKIPVGTFDTLTLIAIYLFACRQVDIRAVHLTIHFLGVPLEGGHAGAIIVLGTVDDILIIDGCLGFWRLLCLELRLFI